MINMFPLSNLLASTFLASYNVSSARYKGEEWREMLPALVTMMGSPVAATLHISLVTPHVYRVLYTVSDVRGGSATPSTVHGPEQLRACLTHFGIPAHDL